MECHVVWVSPLAQAALLQGQSVWIEGERYASAGLADERAHACREGQAYSSFVKRESDGALFSFEYLLPWDGDVCEPVTWEQDLVEVERVVVSEPQWRLVIRGPHGG